MLSTASVVLHTGGLRFGTEKAVLELVLGRRPGVLAVSANPASQTAHVTFDSDKTSVADLRRWVEECGYHCAGQLLPEHICDATDERAVLVAMSIDAMVQDIRNRFLVAAVLSVPILLWSAIGRQVLLRCYSSVRSARRRLPAHPEPARDRILGRCAPRPVKPRLRLAATEYRMASQAFRAYYLRLCRYASSTSTWC